MPSSDGAIKRQISLEALNFIERHPGPLASKNNETNLNSFKGLIAAATPYAKEALEVRAQAAKAKKKRLESKKPKLVVNNPEKLFPRRLRAVFYSRRPLTDFPLHRDRRFPTVTVPPTS